VLLLLLLVEIRREAAEGARQDSSSSFHGTKVLPVPIPMLPKQVALCVRRYLLLLALSYSLVPPQAAL
jgi:hypothetical protein